MQVCPVTWEKHPTKQLSSRQMETATPAPLHGGVFTTALIKHNIPSQLTPMNANVTAHSPPKKPVDTYK